MLSSIRLINKNPNGLIKMIVNLTARLKCCIELKKLKASSGLTKLSNFVNKDYEYGYDNLFFICFIYKYFSYLK